MPRPRASWVRCPNVPPNWNLYPVWRRESCHVWPEAGKVHLIPSHLHRLSKLPSEICSQLPLSCLGFLSRAKSQNLTSSLSVFFQFPKPPHLHVPPSSQSLPDTSHLARSLHSEGGDPGSGSWTWGVGRQVWDPSAPCPVSMSAQIPAGPGW